MTLKLDAAHVLFEHLGYGCEKVTFDSRSGPLHVARNCHLLTLDFPAEPPLSCVVPSPFCRGRSRFDRSPAPRYTVTINPKEHTMNVYLAFTSAPRMFRWPCA